LSIVFGTPTTGMPSACRRSATPSVSSPPIGISASISRARIAASTAAVPSRPSAYGFVRDVPRIVPPRGRIPDVLASVSSSASFSITPAQPWRKPTKLLPSSASPRRTTARITAFNPGQSPPPVSSPTRI